MTKTTVSTVKIAKRFRRSICRRSRLSAASTRVPLRLSSRGRCSPGSSGAEPLGPSGGSMTPPGRWPSGTTGTPNWTAVAAGSANIDGRETATVAASSVGLRRASTAPVVTGLGTAGPPAVGARTGARGWAGAPKTWVAPAVVGGAAPAIAGLARGPASAGLDVCGSGAGACCLREALGGVAPNTWVRLVSDGTGEGVGAAGGPPKTCVPPAGGGAGFVGTGGPPKTCVRLEDGDWGGEDGPTKAGGLWAAVGGTGNADGTAKTSVRLEASAKGPGCASGGCAPKTWVRLPAGAGAAGVAAEDWLPNTCVRVSADGSGGEWVVPKVGVGVTPAPRAGAGGVPPKICVPALGGAGFWGDAAPGDAS